MTCRIAESLQVAGSQLFNVHMTFSLNERFGTSFYSKQPVGGEKTHFSAL